MSVEELENRLVGHKKADSDDGVYVGRPTEFGNPYPVGDDIEIDGEVVVEEADRDAVVEYYETWLVERLQEDAEFRERVKGLAGQRLDCWCQVRGENGARCHATVLAKWALYLENEA